MNASRQCAGYLFAYFTGENTADGEQVRFARSRGDDVLQWDALNGGHPIVVSTVGTRGVRDPFLIRAAGLPGETAKFYLIATDLKVFGGDPETIWEQVQHRGSTSIVVWESPDLVAWTDPRLVDVAPPEAGNAWAPEATFDRESGQYLVYWASRLRTDPHPYNKMFCATTTDFRSFSAAEVWNDPGHDVIDSTVARSDGVFYRFTKDERLPDASVPGAKFLTAESSPSLRSTTYDLVAEGVGVPDGTEPPGVAGLAHGEGPIIVQAIDGSGWYLFIDEFGLRGYVPFHSPRIDGAHWVMCAGYELPPGARHGSILPMTAAEWKRLGLLG